MARARAVGEISIPEMSGWMFSILLDREERRRRGMQPVPVQKSMTRTLLGCWVSDWMSVVVRWARVSVYASVHCLGPN